MIKQYVTSTCARETISNIISRVKYHKEIFIVKRHNKHLVAIVPIEVLHRLEELEAWDARQRRMQEAYDRVVP